MYAMSQRHVGARGERALKRKLIQDPDQAFWEGSRPKLGATLGDATEFSLLAPLCDANNTLKRMGLTGEERSSLAFRFSHPNWISPEKATSLSYYKAAVIVALSAFCNNPECLVDEGVFHLSVANVRNLVERHRSNTAGLAPQLPVYEHTAYRDCLQGTINGLA